ncbi:MAG: glycosyltransferase [uncultured bacterium (gcode 4)]|uniref:Glycosyltransferase n=1 Tax=uncultured bacterium (gcode 4) TaxID=1234023 RepID=K2F545_9BACT|nr:MAG: glycosyltransferase [uncultured bacterium (gcode 4)]
MKKKRILIVSWTFFPAWSYWGIARVMFELAREYVKDWHHVDCISTDVFDNNSRNPKTEDNIDWMNIYYFKNVSHVLANKWKFPIPIWLRKWLKENIRNYDIVHIADFRNLMNYFTYKECIKNDIPYIVSSFGSIAYNFDFKMIIKKLFDFFWARKMMKQAKFVTSENENEAKCQNELWVPKEKIRIIPLMLDYEKFVNLSEPWEVRKKLNIDKDAKVLLFVWRIHRYKMPYMALDCFYDYQKKIPNSHFIIIWRDDGFEDNLKKYAKKLWIADKVSFQWAIYYPETIKYYIDADVYFMAPNHWEWTPTASLECLACWTPVVWTKQSLIPFIENYDAWYIVNFDKEELVNALLKVKEKNSQDCINMIKDHFDVRVIKNDFLSTYFDK